jgi:hypothetical protein
MADNIQEYDLAFRLKGTPVSWHGKETETEVFDALAIKYEKEELLLPSGYIYANSNCKYNIVAKRDEGVNLVIATASDGYVVRGNDEIMEKIQSAFDKHGIPAKLVFGLTMGNLSKLALTYTVENMEEFFAGGQEHKMFLCVVSGHDKVLGTRFFGTGTKIVCQNTMEMSLKGTKHFVNMNFFHNKNGQKEFDNLPQLLESTLAHSQEYSEFAEQLGNVAITIQQAKAIALQMMASEEKSVISTQLVNRSEEIANLFKNGLGNKGENLWDFVGGTTEFFTRGDGSGKTTNMKKVVSADYGTAMQTKMKMINALRTDSGDLISQQEIANMVTEGEAMLRNYEKNKAKDLVLV